MNKDKRRVRKPTRLFEIIYLADFYKSIATDFQLLLIPKRNQYCFYADFLNAKYTSKKGNLPCPRFDAVLPEGSLFINLFFGDGLYSGEAVFQIGDDVVDVLRTDGETDGVLVDSCRVKLLVGEL